MPLTRLVCNNRTIMEDRPDLIQSELTGMAFDSLQCVFRPADIEVMFTQEPPEPVLNADIYLFIDPAAGGPQSDYAILSFQRIKGLVTVSVSPIYHCITPYSHMFSVNQPQRKCILSDMEHTWHCSAL